MWKRNTYLIFYKDKYLYTTLANYPITKGYVVIVWKKKVTDLHLLKKKDYESLMDAVRYAMLKALKIKKVYLIYMYEANQVHWHLFQDLMKKALMF